ncbi:calcineurin-like phosphoesterase [Plectosphaerella plurivora]|uniref:Calcineurin-like phosphoesterase n=1 Tax=Plectosphaerella plurivora TaxID=936078 RepID=A0A9P8V9A6_9PEZI|nr:calcineurin-like phosphoesterase [Plectosphaerella plurivora]
MRVCVVPLVCFLAGAVRSASIGKYQTSNLNGPLRFNVDGSFKISVFQDLHFGENAWEDWGPAQDKATLRVINSVLDNGNPDLVVLNGDLTTGENLFVENSTNYIDMMVAPMVDRGLPWASTYGNHDYQVNISGHAILEREQQYTNARTRQMVSGDDIGVSNYYLPVYPADCVGCDCAPELMLWFFDSRGGFRYQELDPRGREVPFPNWVDETVVEWFKESNARIQGRFGKVIPSLGFVHIPTNASQTLQLAGVNPNRQPGVDNDRPLSQQAQGWCADGRSDSGCSYGGQDIPFMEAVASTPGMMALFSGHDHGNTWCHRWEGKLPGMSVAGNGVNLCFGQHTGYGGYSSWIRGARQISITRENLEKFEVDTWNLLEDGRAVGAVTLNATYGQDWYPAVPNDRTSCDC